MTVQSIQPNRFIPRNWFKRFGLFLVALWLIVLVAAVASLIYQRFDGPTIQSVTAANMSLENQNLNLNVKSASLQARLSSLSTEIASLQSQLLATSVDLDSARSRLATTTKQHAEIWEVLSQFVTVVPLELYPGDLILSR